MKVTIQTKSGQFACEAEPGETILAAGLRSGISLPYECATGTCGTCRARVMQGDTEMSWAEAPGAAKLKRERGDCLMCQTVPRSDTLVRVPSLTVASAPPDPLSPAHRKGEIVARQALTRDVVHLDVRLDRPISFKPGQFVTFQVEGVTGARAYSMVNYAAETRAVSFVVKRLVSGAFTRWLFEAMEVGAPVRLFGPLGAATFDPAADGSILCAGGGSGIAGLMSIVGSACQARHFDRHAGHVYFGVRTMQDTFYMAELANFVRAAEGALQVTVVLSDEAPPADRHPDFPELRLDHGFVHQAMARGMAGRFDGLTAFVAGPPPMVDAAIRVLITEGKLPVSAIRYDKFS